jgi:hypothetical protein
VSALREAILLPLTFLTVALLGGLEPGALMPWVAPSLFSLVLAVLLVAALVRGGAVAPDRLLHGSRLPLANANGAAVLASLFAASAQVLHMLTPRHGLPAVIVALILLLLLANTLVISPDRPKLLRSLALVLGSAFVLKFVLLDALADPEGGPTKRVLVALFDAATLGTITQNALPASAGYLAFMLVMIYLVAVSALPAARSGPPHQLDYPAPRSSDAIEEPRRRKSLPR